VWIAVGIAGLCGVLTAARWPLLQRVEWITFDWRVRLAQLRPAPVAPNLGFVDIDDRSIAALKDGTVGLRVGLYWPRQVYGRLVQELAAQGARAVAFDVLFGELREDHPPVLMADGTQVESDQFFADQMARAGNVILAADRGMFPPPLFATNALAVGDIAAERDADGVLRRARAFQVYRQWHPAFLQAATEFGVNLAQARVEPDRILLTLPDGEPLPPIRLDADGQFALADLGGTNLPAGLPARARPFTDRRVWHLGIVLAAQELKLDLAHAAVDLAAGRIRLRGAEGVERVLPVDGEGYFYIDWALTAFDERLTTQNIVTVLQAARARARGQAERIPNVWKDKLVVVGSTATGNDLTDLGATPLANETFLLSKHWNVANAVLQNRFIRRTPLAEELLLLLLLSLLAAGLTAVLPPPWSSLAVAGAGLMYVAMAAGCYVHSRLWLPLVLPGVGGLGLTHGAVVAYQALFEQREKRRVKSVFSKIVSPNVVHELLQAKTLSLGGARREVTIFFADVRGFTELTDVSQERAAEYIRRHGLSGEAAEACYAEQARETLATVNLYLALVADRVKQHDGTLDKYIGDCVMAFWGAPTPNPRHARAAVRAAIDAQRAVAELNRRRAAENDRLARENLERAAAGQPPRPLLALLQLGTGINTGIVTVGLMGSDQHLFNYTVFGREVNLASRLESVSGHGRIVISETTYQHLLRDDPELARTCRALPPVTVKGIRAAVALYEVPWHAPGEAGQGDARPVAGSAAAVGSAPGS